MNTHRLLFIGCICFFYLSVSLRAQTWTQLNSNSTAGLRGCHYVDPDIAFFVGSNRQILRTEDGGNTFTATTYNSGAGEFFDVFFTDVSTGYVVGDDGQILKTVNGGDTWTSLNSQSFADLRCVRFLNANVGFVTGSDCSILRTDDAGATWVPQNTPNDGNGIYGIDFPSVNTALAAGWTGRVYRSSDAGANWNYSTVSTESLLDVHFISPLVGFVVGRNGLIRKTTDGGNSWTTVPSGSTTSYFTRIWFADANRGYIAGGDVPENDGTITSSTDGGLTWSTEYTGSSRLYGFYMGPKVGYACGLDGTILKFVNTMDTPEASAQPAMEPLSVYPNPASEVVQLQPAPGHSITRITVIDYTGRTVKQVNPNTASTVQLPVQELAVGQYMILAQTQDGSIQTQKLLVSR